MNSFEWARVKKPKKKAWKKCACSRWKNLNKACPHREKCSYYYFKSHQIDAMKKKRIKYKATWGKKIVNPNATAIVKTKKSRTSTQEDYQMFLSEHERYETAKGIIRALTIGLKQTQCRLASAWKLLHGWTQPIPPFGHMARTHNFLKKKPQW